MTAKLYRGEMDLIVNLPGVLLGEVLNSWVEIQDIVRLDSAICSKGNREKFLSFLTSPILTVNLLEWRDEAIYDQLAAGFADACELCMDWIIRRKIGVTAVCATESLSSNMKLRREYLQQHGSKIIVAYFDSRRWNVRNCKMVLKDILEYCPNVIDLKCADEFTPKEYNHIVATWPDLGRIELGERADDKVLKLIAKSCQELTAIHADECRFLTPSGWEKFLSTCNTEMEVIVCIQSEFTEKAYHTIATRFPELTTMRVDMFQLTDDLLIKIAEGCPCLEDFDMSVTTNISDSGFSALARNGRLTEMFLQGTELTDASVTEAARCCADITYVNFSSCPGITDESVLAVGANCPKLTCLTVNYTDTITDIGLLAIAKGCPRLAELNANHCRHITDVGVLAISRSCPDLALVRVACASLTDETVMSLVESHPNMLSLNLGCIASITDRSVLSIAEHCAGLEELALEGTDVTVSAVVELAQSCTSLTMIQLSREVGEQVVEMGIFSPEVRVVIRDQNGEEEEEEDDDDNDGDEEDDDDIVSEESD